MVSNFWKILSILKVESTQTNVAINQIERVSVFYKPIDKLYALIAVTNIQLGKSLPFLKSMFLLFSIWYYHCVTHPLSLFLC